MFTKISGNLNYFVLNITNIGAIIQIAKFDSKLFKLIGNRS